MNNQLQMRKNLGQNFLQDQNILKKIIESAQLTAEDTVLEVGTGSGLLTEHLAKSNAKVHTIEIDREKYLFSKNHLDHLTNIEFILGDFLIKAKDIFKQLAGKKVKVIANIPYYITTALIEKLLFYKNNIDFIEIMIQKEVADRLTAQPGTKQYGSLTLFVQYHASVTDLFKVSRNCFYPKPTVDSKVVKITPLATTLPVSNEDLLFRIIKAGFWGRRKTLANCLKQAVYTKFNDKTMIALSNKFPQINQIRAEKLSLQEFIELTDFISNFNI